MDSIPNHDATLIEEAGGTTAVARLCGVKPPSVSEWKRNGIPKAQRNFLRLALPTVFDPKATEANTPRRIDTPEAAAAALGVARAASSAPEDPACIDLPLDDACSDPDDALQPGELDPPTLDPDDPNYDPDADRLGPAVETA